MIRKILASALTLFSFIAGAQSVLGYYNFSNVTATTGTVDPTPVPVATGLAFGSFTAMGVSANPNASFRFTYTGWPLGATNGVDTYSTFTGVLTPTAYYEVSLTPQSGYSVGLSSVVFSMRRSSTGVRNFAVRSSADGFTNNLPASVNSTNMSVESPNVFFWNFDATSNATDIKGNTITLGGTAFSSFTNALTFRFYAWNAEGSGGTFSLDSVVFFGAASNTTLAPVSLNKEKLNSSSLRVFPNPSHDGKISVLFSEAPAGPAGVEVFNLLGQKVTAQRTEGSGNRLELDLSHCPSGAYFLKVYTLQGTKTERVLISR